MSVRASRGEREKGRCSPMFIVWLLLYFAAGLHAQTVESAGELNARGLAAFSVGHYPEATALYRHALEGEERRAAGAPTATAARITNNLAVMAQTEGHLADARRLYTRSLEIS